MSSDASGPITSPSPLKVAIIGGSGLGDTFDAQDAIRHDDPATPFGSPSAAILETTFHDVPVLLLKRHGEGHPLSPTQVPYRANIFALKQLGATHILASGACGSLREEFEPRHLVIADQTIDRTRHRADTFYEHAAVHVEFADPFCPVLRGLLGEAGQSLETTVHPRGTYVCMEGPAFSSRAESRMHRLWGGDLIGMTLLPEAKLAREAELPYAAVNLVTDYDAWRPRDEEAPHDPFALLSEIIGHLKSATANASALLRETVRLMGQRQDHLQTCPARDALQLAIWSNKDTIDPAEVGRLKVLWGRHFEAQPSA